MEEYIYKKNCKGISVIQVIISIIVAVIIGVIFANGLITTVFNFAIIALVGSAISIVTLLISLFTANVIGSCNNFERCICNKGIGLIASIIGTILFSIVLLSVDIVATTIASIVILAITVFFFMWMLLSIMSLLYCILKETVG